ncbi:MAG: hypothetical protein Q8P15_01405 [Nanoarchaeota archaeon]|nr:hypothetical protein [Nanoarchaeota archaeon]
MNFIKKIFEGKIGEDVHLQFQKFSKGEFRDKALVKARRTGGKYTITTTPEFANEMVRNVAEKLGERKTNVTGAIVSTSDLTGKIDFKEKKQFQEVKRYLIDKEMSGREIINLLDEFPKTFFALSFKSEDSELKIKPKAPKSAKPGSKGDERPKPDFCKLITTDSELGKSFIFEKPDFKSADLNHTFFIDEIIAPQGEKDFAKIREVAKRKGRILREGEIDGEKIREEKGFSA